MLKMIYKKEAWDQKNQKVSFFILHVLFINVTLLYFVFFEIIPRRFTTEDDLGFANKKLMSANTVVIKNSTRLVLRMSDNTEWKVYMNHVTHWPELSDEKNFGKVYTLYYLEPGVAEQIKIEGRMIYDFKEGRSDSDTFFFVLAFICTTISILYFLSAWWPKKKRI